MQKERWITALPKVYTRKDFAVESDAVKPNQILKWKYLEQIKNELNLNPNVKSRDLYWCKLFKGSRTLDDDAH